jgi:hypothetical protein
MAIPASTSTPTVSFGWAPPTLATNNDGNSASCQFMILVGT